MGLWGAIGSALSSAISKAISKSKSSSSSLGSKSSGSSYSSGSNNSGSSGSGVGIRDYLSGTGKDVTWNASSPDTVKIGDSYYRVGNIGGTRYDPATSTHYVTDEAAFRKSIGLPSAMNTVEPPPASTGKSSGTSFDALLDAIAQMGANTAPNYDQMLDQVYDRMPAAPTPEPTLSYAEARQRAQDQLNPLYGQTMEKALKAVDESNIRRGFFGQLPGAALSRSTAADIEANKAAAIGQLSNQLVGQSEANARANQALAQQAWGTQTNALLQALQQGVSQQSLQQNQAMNLFNAILGIKALEQNDKKLQSEEERAWLPWLIGGGY